MTDISQIYPFSTQDGKAIPLDIVQSKGFLFKSFTLTAASFTVPADKLVGVCFASESCLIRVAQTLPSSLTEDFDYSDTLLLPKGMAVTTVFTPGIYYVRGLDLAGTVYIQFVEKWVGLALERQFGRK